MSCARHPQTGLTLLEIMIGLAIAAILLTLAVPSMQSLTGRSDMTATNNRLVFSLQTARSEAIKRAVAVVLCPSENPLNASATCSGGYGDGWIVFEDADGNGLRAATEELILQTDASSPAFSITPDTVFEDRIFFNLMGASVNPSGGPLSGSILLDYQGGAQQRRVDVGASGRISTTVLSP